MTTFFRAAGLFVGHPERAWFVAAAFVLLFLGALRLKSGGRANRPWMILIPTLGWLLFGVVEQLSTLAGWNIRVDLLLTWPGIILLTIVPVGLWLASFRGAGRGPGAARAAAPTEAED